MPFSNILHQTNVDLPGKPVIVPADYPDDNDTNAVAFSVIKPTEEKATELIDEIAECTNQDGVIQVHLDPKRPRVAPEVTANILTLFYAYGRGNEVRSSLNYLQKELDKPDFEPTRYYWMPETLFFYTWRFLRSASGATTGDNGPIDQSAIPEELLPLRDRLITRVKARIGEVDFNDALSPAVRLLICQTLGVENDEDMDLLLALQEKEGGFGKGWYVRYGSCGIKISHPGLVGVLAIEALKARLFNSRSF